VCNCITAPCDCATTSTPTKVPTYKQDPVTVVPTGRPTAVPTIQLVNSDGTPCSSASLGTDGQLYTCKTAPTCCTGGGGYMVGGEGPS
jgi:hypothetical protein